MDNVRFVDFEVQEYNLLEVWLDESYCFPVSLLAAPVSNCAITSCHCEQDPSMLFRGFAARVHVGRLEY